METVLKWAITNHLQQTSALSAAQHGFIPHHSCLFNLLAAEEWLKGLVDTDEGVDLVNQNLANDFDSVYHRI